MGFGAVLTSSLVCFCAGALYGWSALIAPLQTRFDVNTGQTGLVFSLAIVSFTVAVTVVPMFSTPRPRTVAVFGMFGAICITAAAYAPSYVTFLALFSGGFGVASGGIYISSIGIAGQTQNHKVTTPVVVASFGLGGAVFGPLWRQLDALGSGLDGLLPLAALLFATSGIAVLQSDFSRPAFPGPSLAIDLRQSDISRSTMLILWSLFALGSFGGLMILGLSAKMMETAGAGVGLASIGLAGVAIGNTSGRLSVAWLASRLRTDHILFLAMACTLLGLMLAMLGEWAVVVCLGLVCVALGYGTIAAIFPVLTHDFCGSATFQKRFAVIFTAWGTAGFLAPWLGGALFDLNESFVIPLLCAFGVGLLFCLISWRLGPNFWAQDRDIISAEDA